MTEFPTVNHPDAPYGKIPKDKIPLPNELKIIDIEKDTKTIRRLDAIHSEIKEVKKLLDDTYDIDRQIKLSKCLVTLYTLKKEVLNLK